MVMVMVAVMVMKAVFALNLPAHCLTSPTLRETSGKKEDLRLSSSISGVSIKLREVVSHPQCHHQDHLSAALKACLS